MICQAGMQPLILFHLAWCIQGGGPRVVVSTAAFHARVRGSVPCLGGLKETQMFLPHPRVKVSIVGSLRDREVACSASDRQGSNFGSCVWRAVSSQSSHHPQEVLKLLKFPSPGKIFYFRTCMLRYFQYSLQSSESVSEAVECVAKHANHTSTKCNEMKWIGL